MEAASMDSVVTLTEASEVIEKLTGHHVPYKTLYHWATVGIGQRRLDTFRVGGRMFLRVRSLFDFIRRAPLESPATTAEHLAREAGL